MREGSGTTLRPIAAQIESAKSHLANHVLSLEDIVRVCGFGSLGHFEKVFVEKTGAMPSAWRRRGLWQFIDAIPSATPVLTIQAQQTGEEMVGGVRGDLWRGASWAAADPRPAGRPACRRARS
ncbi:helix-turn-helix domain-containing protein [Ensifer adhaerens]|uniref:helix-turn-helix domain-containing protein n=1 Tax=Ensifer adhaerens TaxID=106592 RepID=UPI003CFF3FAE